MDVPAAIETAEQRLEYLRDYRRLHELEPWEHDGDHPDRVALLADIDAEVHDIKRQLRGLRALLPQPAHQHIAHSTPHT